MCAFIPGFFPSVLLIFLKALAVDVTSLPLPSHPRPYSVIHSIQSPLSITSPSRSSFSIPSTAPSPSHRFASSFSTLSMRSPLLPARPNSSTPKPSSSLSALLSAAVPALSPFPQSSPDKNRKLMKGSNGATSKVNNRAFRKEESQRCKRDGNGIQLTQVTE